MMLTQLQEGLSCGYGPGQSGLNTDSTSLCAVSVGTLLPFPAITIASVAQGAVESVEGWL